MRMVFAQTLPRTRLLGISCDAARYSVVCVSLAPIKIAYRSL